MIFGTRWNLILTIIIHTCAPVVHYLYHTQQIQPRPTFQPFEQKTTKCNTMIVHSTCPTCILQSSCIIPVDPLCRQQHVIDYFGSRLGQNFLDVARFYRCDPRGSVALRKGGFCGSPLDYGAVSMRPISRRLANPFCVSKGVREPWFSSAISRLCFGVIGRFH